MSSDKSLETKGIRVSFILEIIGCPPEHLIKTLEEIIKQIDNEKGVKVLSKEIKEPVLLKDSKEFYSTFAEIEIEVENILYIAILMFKYMPAHVEIIEPELIALTNNGWTDIFSEVTRRLHGYEEIARVLQIENKKLNEKLKELMPEEDSKKIEEEEKVDSEQVQVSSSKNRERKKNERKKGKKK